VTIGGGADIARQFGNGVRLFEGFDQTWHLTKTRVIDGPDVTHLRYRVDGPR
jgi:hypothetical protein